MRTFRAYEAALDGGTRIYGEARLYDVFLPMILLLLLLRMLTAAHLVVADEDDAADLSGL